MKSSWFILAIFLISLLISNVSAQLGPTIVYPEHNATINATQTLKIRYEYQNMGTGNYSVDIALWLDPKATQLIQNITTNEKIVPGNSTGIRLNFTLDGSYDWVVPRGLNETVYLTVTETADTRILLPFRIQSSPVLLHFSAGLSALSAYSFTLTVACLSVIALFLL
ncbi:hypothetical protein CLU79DRAFT_756817 [Phycomyces nitens]|nr:hypothetical protein CLU79DRAFT_756817 [Phycomyces nitens]